MPTRAGRTIYHQTVRISDTYLGPAAERFIDRQVREHLRKDPQDITEKDLAQLIRWIRLAVSMLTDNSQVVDEYINRLERLTRPS
jgi:hypothetical protein